MRVLAGLLCFGAAGAAAAAKSLDNESIREAVKLWLSDRAAADAKYGHIKDWDTSAVTDMKELFCASDQLCSYSNTAAVSFNEDISKWDTSGVTTTSRMFRYASAFNRDIGGWAVHSVTDMSYMFHEASAFDQDIGAWDT